LIVKGEFRRRRLDVLPARLLLEFPQTADRSFKQLEVTRISAPSLSFGRQLTSLALLEERDDALVSFSLHPVAYRRGQGRSTIFARETSPSLGGWGVANVSIDLLRMDTYNLYPISEHHRLPGPSG
jgi:hypothetical protein